MKPYEGVFPRKRRRGRQSRGPRPNRQPPTQWHRLESPLAYNDGQNGHHSSTQDSITPQEGVLGDGEAHQSTPTTDPNSTTTTLDQPSRENATSCEGNTARPLAKCAQDHLGQHSNDDEQADRASTMNSKATQAKLGHLPVSSSEHSFELCTNTQQYVYDFSLGGPVVFNQEPPSCGQDYEMTTATQPLNSRLSGQPPHTWASNAYVFPTGLDASEQHNVSIQSQDLQKTEKKSDYRKERWDSQHLKRQAPAVSSKYGPDPTEKYILNPSQQ